MNLALVGGMEYINEAIAEERKRVHKPINVTVEKGEECRFIKTQRGGYFTTDQGVMWAYDEMLTGRDLQNGRG